ncbi:MAG: pseudouridine synthase [Christensenellales bacterium]|jgi:23S rRNA pseudouridine955/2504/2580 synthase
MVSLTVQKTYNGIELAGLLEEMYPDFSPKAFKAAFKAGDITLNGQKAYGDDTVKTGDVIRIFVTGDILGVNLIPKNVYQDENFVFVDKPAGLPTVSEAGEPNVVNMVEELMKQKGQYSLRALLVPYLIYPLEKYVSGLLLFAKHEDAYLFLVEALNQRRIIRYYVCPVKGHAEEGDELMAYLTQNKAKKHVAILDKHQKDAKPIVTRYTALLVRDEMSLLRVRPVTNFLHQVRAHLAFDGLPIVGDSVYGDKRFNKKTGADHIALWLKTVMFEVGNGHEYMYMNGKRFESQSHSFPRCVYDQGLVKAGK